MNSNKTFTALMDAMAAAMSDTIIHGENAVQVLFTDKSVRVAIIPVEEYLKPVKTWRNHEWLLTNNDKFKCANCGLLIATSEPILFDGQCKGKTK